MIDAVAHAYSNEYANVHRGLHTLANETTEAFEAARSTVALPASGSPPASGMIARANASDYGLGGSVWSADPMRAAEIAGRIESGQVWVNQHIAIGPHIPMAGFKSSGLGVEQAEEGLAEYTQLQVINIKR